MKRTFTSVIIFKRLDLISCNSLNSDDVTQNNVNPEFERKIVFTRLFTGYPHYIITSMVIAMQRPLLHTSNIW